MKIANIRLATLVTLILATFSIATSANTGVYLGAGLNYLDFDGDNSQNMCITAGYNVKKWRFESTTMQAIIVGIEAQYSDSILGVDNVNHYSVFAVLRVYTSEQWFFKVKQGFTDFPDVTLSNSSSENSHLGAGIGLGYRIDSGSIEIEYIYPNKTINGSVFEISYKYHF